MRILYSNLKHLSFRSGQIAPDHTPFVPSYESVTSNNKFFDGPASLFRSKAHLLTKVKSTDYKSRQKISNKIIEYGFKYISKSSNYYVRLWDKLNNKDCEIKLYNRFDLDYLQKQKDKLYRLHWSSVPHYFLTFTIDFRKFDSIYDGYEELGKEWNRFLSHLKKFDKGYQFIKVLEIQTQNTKNVHIHSVLKTNLEKKDLEAILQYINIGFWDLGDMREYFFQKHKRYPSNKELIEMADNYVLKYIKKGYEESDSEASKINKFVLWSLYARTFSYRKTMKGYGSYTKLHNEHFLEAYKKNPDLIKRNRLTQTFLSQKFYISQNFLSYHLTKFYTNQFINFSSHQFFEIMLNRYEFLTVLKF